MENDFDYMCSLSILIKGIQHDDEPEAATVINRAAIPDFVIEYSSTDQDACKGCTQQMQMAELRIMQFVPESGQAHCYHVPCFVRLRSEIGWQRSGDSLSGFKRLNPNDKITIKNQIPYV